jgi:hypothetical protein
MLFKIDNLITSIFLGFILIKLRKGKFKISHALIISAVLFVVLTLVRAIDPVEHFETNPFNGFPDGYFRIRTRLNDSDSNGGNGITVASNDETPVLRRYTANQVGKIDDLWYADPNGRLKSVKNNRTLRVSGSGNQVQLADMTGDSTEEFLFEPDTGRIRSKMNQRILTVLNDSTDDNAFLTLEDISARSDIPKSQRWYLEIVKKTNDVVRLIDGTQDAKVEKLVENQRLPPANQFAFMGWFKITNKDYRRDSEGTILRKGNNFRLFLVAKGVDGAMSLGLEMNHTKNNKERIMIPNSDVTADIWNHVTVVSRNYEVVVLVNQVEVMRRQIDGLYNQTSTDLIMCEQGGFEGFIHEWIYLYYPSMFQDNSGGRTGSNDAIYDIVKGRELTQEILVKIIQETDPRERCKKVQETTVINENILTNTNLRNDWFYHPSLGDVISNEVCPMEGYGGETVGFNLRNRYGFLINYGRKDIRPNANRLLPKMKYRISIWIRTTDPNGIAVQPYTGSSDSSTDITAELEKSNRWWGKKQVVKASEGWKKLEWAYEHTERFDQGVEKRLNWMFETEQPNKWRNYLFMPVLIPEIASTLRGTIKNIKYITNGKMDPTCKLTDAGLDGRTGWCVINNNDANVYLEAQFDDYYRVKQLHIQGRADYPQWTEKVKIMYLNPYSGDYAVYKDEFETNKDMYTTTDIDVDFVTNRVRIYPTQYHMSKAMRIDFSGDKTTLDECLIMEQKVKTAKAYEKDALTEEYNKTCRKISYYQHSKEIGGEKMKYEDLLKKYNELDGQKGKYGALYENAVKRNKDLELQYAQTEVELDKIRNSKCPEQPKALPGTCNVNMFDVATHNEFEKRCLDAKKIDNCSKIMEDIQKNGIDKCGVDLNQLKFCKFEGKDFASLMDEMSKCRGRFNPNGRIVEKFSDSNIEMKKRAIMEPFDLQRDTFANMDNTYDIKNHKDYPQLRASIEQEMKEKYGLKVDNTCPGKFLPCPKELKNHPGYNALRNEIEQEMKNKYGLKVDNTCPGKFEPCKKLDEYDITKHPDINKFILKSSLPKDLDLNDPNTIKMLKQCQKAFKSTPKNALFEQFQGENKSESLLDLSNLNKVSQYDIRRHVQYRDLLNEVKEQCDARNLRIDNKCKNNQTAKLQMDPNVRDMLQKKELQMKAKCDKQIEKAVEETRKQYGMLVKESCPPKYAPCPANIDPETYRKKIMKEMRITDHPDIDKYLLKTSIPPIALQYQNLLKTMKPEDLQMLGECKKKFKNTAETFQDYINNPPQSAEGQIMEYAQNLRNVMNNGKNIKPTSVPSDPFRIENHIDYEKS